MLMNAENCCDFLREELARRTSVNGQYSQRAFARDLGLSPGEISEILANKRPLSAKSAGKIAEKLNLSEPERRHLAYLVQGQRAKEKNSNIQNNNYATLTGEVFEMVSRWYYFAILSLFECHDFKGNPKWISERLGISTAEVQAALQRLTRVGLLRKKARFFEPVRDFMVSSAGIPSEAIRNYHRENLLRAVRALEHQSVLEREVVGLSVAISKKDLPKIKREMNDFVDGVTVRYAKGRDRDEVYQLEMAFFRQTGSKR